MPVPRIPRVRSLLPSSRAMLAATAAVRTSVRWPASASSATGSPVSAEASSIMPLPVGRPRAALPGKVLAIFSAKYLPPRR